MNIIRTGSYEEMSARAANLIAAQVTLYPESVLGLATGSTPIGTYQELVRRYEAGELDFSRASSVNLDEYCDIPRDNPNSYYTFMRQNLFDHINIPLGRTAIPNAEAADMEAECRRYEKHMRTLGGIDLQLLGIGKNGHIGFNEPGDEFVVETHVVQLDESTILANARFFDSEEEVPRRAITIGIRAILQARKVVLVASGKDKQEILERAVHGPVTPRVPASILQMHPDCTVIYCD